MLLLTARPRLGHRLVMLLEPEALAAPMTAVVEEAAAAEAVTEAAVETLFSASANWNFVLVGVALAVGGLFESTVELIKERLPKQLLPAVERSVTELATLGFVGLFIELVNAGRGAEVLSDVSLRYLGEADFLVERFESLHEALFTVTILYFLACTLLIVRISAQFREWGAARRDDYLRFKVAEYEFKQQTTGGAAQRFSRRGWSQAAEKMEMAPPPPRWGALGVAWAEATAGEDYRVAEFLRFRDRFIEQARREVFPLPRAFAFDEYLEQHAAQNLRDLVSVEPRTLARMWAPVAATSWAAELGGLSARGVALGPPLTEQGLVLEVDSLAAVFCAAQLLLGAWALANFYALASAKVFLRPQLARKTATPAADDDAAPAAAADAAPAADADAAPADGATVRRLVPPAFCLCGGGPAAAPQWGALAPLVARVQRPWARAARNAHEALFGAVGASGPRFYLESQKLVLFNAIVSVAVAVSLAGEGAPVPLLGAALVPAALAIALSPATFLAWNWATAVEELKDVGALRRVLRAQRERAFQARVRTLGLMCDVFERAACGALRVGATEGRRALRELLDDGSPSRIYNLQTVFDFADEDGGGTLCRGEVAALARTLGFELADGCLDLLFEQLACGPDGCAVDIQFGDFASAVIALEACAPCADGQLASARAARLFGFFDASGHGHIGLEDMARRLESLGFDAAGTEQLFVDITGFPKRAISRAEFDRYLADEGLLAS